ncbi:MAG: T9SS type A sorting domain-containing protein [Bacteroidota bacterium]|nr:T9SS type A sorting domain-containing protein [Bacteroidota bacterium]
MKNILLIITFLFTITLMSQIMTFPRGSYIVNMGVIPQTVGNGLKPYGLIYDLVNNYDVSVKWIIRQGKPKDSFDFIHNNVRYSGGPFLIPKQYINSTTLSRLAYWVTQGVVLDTLVSDEDLIVTYHLNSMPNWTINSTNSNVAIDMYPLAGIPNTSYNLKSPSSLGACDDIFVMPHADPTWADHSNLRTWNINNRGAIFAMCHAVSVLENLVNPSNSAQRMNFLSNNGLIDYMSHADGTPPYNYFFNRASYNGSPISARVDDPVFQMIGKEDGAHLNGSEQIFIPVAGAGSGWRNTTKIGCYDSTQSNVSSFPNGPAAVTLYGRGFGQTSNGLVMYQGGHDIALTRSGSSRFTTAENISAVRQFFNFSLIAMGDKNPALLSVGVPSIMFTNNSYNVSVNASSPVGATLSYEWSSSCSGTFANRYASTTTFTPDTLNLDSNCVITCIVSDGCNRRIVNNTSTNIYAALPLSLLDFKAVKRNRLIEVKWVSAEESRITSFDVMRSYDGLNFEKIATLNPNNNAQTNQYLYHDYTYNVNVEIIYYQLKINENDGSFKTSSVDVIERSQVHPDIKSINPNPANSDINIETKISGRLINQILIFNSKGQLIKSFSLFDSESKTFSFDVSDLSKGLYFINILKKDGHTITAKFAKS